LLAQAARAHGLSSNEASQQFLQALRDAGLPAK
jgi:hypothetical protein